MLDGYTLEPLCAFVVPGKPVPKQRPRTVRAGGKVRTYTPKKTMEFEHRVSWAAAGVLGVRDPPVATVGQPLYIRVVAVYDRPAYLKSRKTPDGLVMKTTRGDGDNLLKAVCDGIGKTHLMSVRLIHDDAQFVGCEVWKFYAERGGKARTEVEIFRLIDNTEAADAV